VVFDLDDWTLSVENKDWELTAGDDSVLAAQVVNSNWPHSLLIDRETGDLSLVSIGGFCQDDACASVWNGVIVQKARCTVPF
jgi:hypothetical protein